MVIIAGFFAGLILGALWHSDLKEMKAAWREVLKDGLNK